LKAFKHDDSKKEVDEFLKLSIDAGYKLCQAGLLWIDSQLAYTKGDTPNLISLNDKSVKLYSQIDCGNLNLAPLMVGIDYQVNITGSDTLAFSNALEGLAKSLKQEEGNKRLAAFAARFARFQTITAHKMNRSKLAEHYIRQAISIAELHNLITYRVEYYCILSALHAEQGNKGVSLELLNKAVNIASTDLTAQKDITMTIHTYKGKIYGLLKSYKTSEAAYKEALQLAKELGTTELIYTAELKKGLGEALCMQGRKVDAKTELAQSKEVFDKARAAYQAMKAPLIKPSFTEKSVEELLVLVEAR
jgi:tetratricopeptide (TPR) repeat protein